MHVSLAVLVAISSLLATGDEPQSTAVPPVAAATSIRLIERGAILAEDFDAKDLDRTKWRVWQENADRTTVVQEKGRLNLTARGPIGHNGLWGLTTAKYKDVVLVGEMDIRSQGSSPHRLALHLCGGDGVRSPDHWVEIDMVDLGDKVRFSPMAALPLGLDRHYDQSLELPHPAEKSFLCRLTLNGDTNLTELTVKTAEGWQRICDPIELPLRTIHTEVKLHGSPGTAGAEETTSQAWFDNVRIYPRPESHHVGIRLVRPDGGQIWFRENGGWPPKIIDSAGKVSFHRGHRSAALHRRRKTGRLRPLQQHGLLSLAAQGRPVGRVSGGRRGSGTAGRQGAGQAASDRMQWNERALPGRCV